MPGAWKADSVDGSEPQPLELTLSQMIGGSLAGQPEGEVRRVRRGSIRAGKGDVSKKPDPMFSLRTELQNGLLGHGALQPDLPSHDSPANLHLSSASSSLNTAPQLPPAPFLPLCFGCCVMLG